MKQSGRPQETDATARIWRDHGRRRRLRARRGHRVRLRQERGQRRRRRLLAGVGRGRAAQDVMPPRAPGRQHPGRQHPGRRACAADERRPSSSAVIGRHP